jgi:hypothetical protein
MEAVCVMVAVLTGHQPVVVPNDPDRIAELLG